MKTAGRVKKCHHADEPVARPFIEPEHFGESLRFLLLLRVSDRAVLFGLNCDGPNSLTGQGFG